MMAGHEPARAKFYERGLFDRAKVSRRGATGMERTARRSIGRIGHVAADDDPLSPGCVGVVQFGHDGQQCFGVGVQWLLVKQLGLAKFADLAEVHDADAVRHVAHDAEVVGMKRDVSLNSSCKSVMRFNT